MQLSIHGCDALRVKRHWAGNANSIRLEIKHGGQTLELCFFDFPEEVTAKLVAEFSDDQTDIPGDKE